MQGYKYVLRLSFTWSDTNLFCRFNIFYPDLIDKTKAPTYRLIKEKGNDDTCIL